MHVIQDDAIAGRSVTLQFGNLINHFVLIINLLIMGRGQHFLLANRLLDDATSNQSKLNLATIWRKPSSIRKL